MLAGNAYLNPGWPLLLLPATAFGGLVVLARSRGAWRTGGGWRAAIVGAMVLLLAGMAVATECLSILAWLNTDGLVVGWGVAAAVLMPCAILLVKKQATPRGSLRLDVAESVLWCAVACIAAILLLLGLAAAPSTWDSMTYHLSRVCHWLQNGRVSHYPTHNLRQLYLGPLAEYGLLHLVGLSGSDRFVNLMQWGCMVGSCLAASLVTARLGARCLGQAVAALCCATLPMGILQSTSTQNDYVAAFLVLGAVYYGMRLAEDRSYAAALLCALCLGLALLTKPTTILFAAPFMVWAVWRLLRRRFEPKRLLGMALLALATVALLNAGYFWRNGQLFGAPLGVRDPVNPDIYSNEVHGGRVIASNLLRNAALHLQSPFALTRGVVWNAVESAHRGLGLDLNDPRTTFAGCRFDENVLVLTRNGDVTGNTVHALLFMFSLLVLAWRRECGEKRTYWLYAACLGLGFTFFCGYLKWQPWHSRLHLPLFVAATPLLGAVVGDCLRRRTALTIAAALVLAAVPWLVRCSTRPLVAQQNVLNTPRLVQQFVERPGLLQGYVTAAIRLTEAKYNSVGLVLGGDDWEYPLWTLLRAGGSQAELHHVEVSNVSRQCVEGGRACEVIVRIDNAAGTVQWEEVAAAPP